MRRIIALASTGWAAIVALAWWLADRRLAECHPYNSECQQAAMSARDYVLIAGLSVAFVAFLAVMFAAQLARRRQASGRITRWQPTTRADRPLLP